MKRPTNIVSLMNYTLVAAVFLLCAAPILAQDPGSSTGSSSSGLTSSSVHESTSSEIPRIWGGITGSYVPFKLFSTGTSTNSTTQETISSTTANGQAGAGVTVNFRIYGNYWLNLGGVYRFGGYDLTDAVNSNTIYLERTRARLLDFPVLVRYAGPHFRWSKYSFYEVGAAVRYATHIELTQAATNGVAYYCCAPPSTTGIHHTIEGVVIGTGVSGKDDFGIVVSPEVRYTRWMGNTFSAPTLSTMRDQLELTVSFGF
jgi:hypothetical protein